MIEEVLSKARTWTVVQGDCREILKQIPDNSVDAVVTDPPAGIEFMGKAWDSFEEREPNPSGPQTEAWHGNNGKNPYARSATPRYRGKTKQSLLPFQDFIAEVFTEVYRVMKPGAHAIVWALPRTSHHTMMGLERAGFDVRDVVCHIFGSGFPKSMDISKQIDKAAGMEREVVGYDAARARPNRKYKSGAIGNVGGHENVSDRTDNGATRTAPATEEAKKWDGWGTALKPSTELWVLAQKPLRVLDACGIVSQEVNRLWRDLATLVENQSRPSHHESGVEKGSSAPENAAIQREGDGEKTTQTGVEEGSSGQMGTSPSISEAVSTSLNIVSSWRSTLDGLSDLAKTSIIETATDLITGLKTLNFSLSQITPDIIIRAVSNPSGVLPLVLDAARRFDALSAYCNSIQTLSAPADAGNPASSSTKMPNVLLQKGIGRLTVPSPSTEFWILCRKPLSENNVAANVLKHGTGGINVDGSRIHSGPSEGGTISGKTALGNYEGGWNPHKDRPTEVDRSMAAGRWPGNLVLSHSSGCVLKGTKKVKAPVINQWEDGAKPFGGGAGHPYKTVKTGDENGMEEVEDWACVDGCPVRELDLQSGELTSGKEPEGGFIRHAPDVREGIYGGGKGLWKDEQVTGSLFGDTGGASRFFKTFGPRPDAPFGYFPKASRSEKEAGLGSEKNSHPTVKNVDLMTWLCRLVTRPDGVVLDPFAGSGTTGIAALRCGFRFIGVEKEPEYAKIAERRIGEDAPLFNRGA